MPEFKHGRFLDGAQSRLVKGLGVLLVLAFGNSGFGAEASSAIRLASLGQSPVFSFIPERQTIDEDTSTGPIPFAIGSSTPVTVDKSSSNTNLVPNLNIFVTTRDNLWEVAVAPATNQFGTTTITLEAEDANGLSTKVAFDLNVNPVPDPLTVRLISPSTNQFFLAPGIVELIADVSDPDERIDRVEYFSDASADPIHRQPSPPFAYTWRDVIRGDYRLTAVAIDKEGGRTTSDPVLIAVRDQLLKPIDQVTVLEGDANTKRTVQVPILGLPTQEKTITYWTSDGTPEDASQGFAAIQNIDYLPIDRTPLKIDANSLTATFTFEILGEVLDERNKRFYINWTIPDPTFLVSTQLVVNIEDDDQPPSVSIDDVQLREGTNEAEFTVTLSAQSFFPAVVVPYFTQNGTAFGGNDYRSTTNFVTIEKGFRVAKIRIPLINDAVDEPNETFFISLGEPLNAVISKGRGQATILDDDPPPLLVARDASATEGARRETNAVFEVTLSAPSGFPVSVNYSTANGTATAESDYLPVSGLLHFQPDQTNRTISVPVLDDLLSEAKETFFLRLNNATNALIFPPAQATAFIEDNEPPPFLSINTAAVLERDTDSTNAVFTVRLSSASGQAVTVDYSTRDVTATAGLDYIETAGSLTFNPRETSKTIEVPVLGDTIIEFNELFSVSLLNAENAVAPADPGFGIIVDNEPATTISISDAPVTTEGDLGFVNAIFNVRLAEAIDEEVTVNYFTVDDTARANSDYVPISLGTLTFQPDVTQRAVSVQILGDTLSEALETFHVVLTNSVNAVIVKGDGIGLIQDDDPLPLISISNASAPEGNGANGDARFQVNLSTPSGQDVSVQFATENDSALAGLDYEESAGTVTIPAGDLSSTIGIPLIGDLVDEPDESFFVNLSTPDHARLAIGGSRGEFTIENDDPSPALVVSEPIFSEGDFEAASESIDVQLSAPSGKSVAVEYRLDDGTATALSDFRPSTGAIVFNPGETNQTVTVEILGDQIREADEVFFLRFENPVSVTLPQNPIPITIENDDLLPGISISATPVLEGDSGLAQALFTAELTAPAIDPVSFDFATEDGSAKAFSDYFPNSGTLIIKPGETRATITVEVSGDRMNEADEAFALRFSNLRNAVPLKNLQAAQAIILNDDPEPAVSVYANAVLEGDDSVFNTIFTFSLSQKSEQSVSVGFTVGGGTAAPNIDFATVSGTFSGTVRFNPGEVEKAVPLIVYGDSFNEPDETVIIRLADPIHARLPDGSGEAQLIILNDDPLPGLSIQDTQAAEGGPNGGSMVFSIALSAPSGQEVTASFSTSNGTASSETDYLATEETVTIAPGFLTTTVTVVLQDDAIPEPGEAFFAKLANPKNAKVAKSSAEGRIIDDDEDPEISIEDAAVEEGNGAVSSLMFPVRLSSPSARPVSVHFATANETAEAGSDYIATADTLSFQPGQTNATIRVYIFSDFDNEPDETLLLRLSVPVNVSMSPEPLEARGTIHDDDEPPRLTIEDLAVLEGNNGSVSAVFPVSLSSPSGTVIPVAYTTVDQTALAGEDYVAASGTLEFQPGQTSRSIIVNVTGDTLREGNESFLVRLTPPPNILPGKTEATGSIVEDDPLPEISIDNVDVVENDAGPVEHILTATLSSLSTETVSVQFRTLDGTASAMTDYQPTEGTLTFAPNETKRTLRVTTIGDTLSESAESFFIQLRAPVNASLSKDRVEFLIWDNDPLPNLVVDNVSTVEGNTGLKELLFTFTLSAPSGRAVSVQFATKEDTALDGSDFIGDAGTVEFAPGETSKSLRIHLFGDTLHEADESFFIDLHEPETVKPDRFRIRATILNDDAAPTLSVSDAEAIEGNSGIFTLIVPVILSDAGGEVVSVDYSLADGSATGGIDFEPGRGTLTLQPGETITGIPVVIHGDNQVEVDETLTIGLSFPVNVTIRKPQGTIRIINDDLLPSLSIADASVTEGADGTIDAVFLVTLSEASTVPITVVYSTVDGTAVSGSDFDRAINKTLVINPSKTTGEIVISVRGDSAAEENEVFFVKLFDPVNARLQDSQAVGTITDDDAPFGISISDAAIKEGDSGITELAFLATLTGSNPNPVSVRYQTLDGTATSPSDFDASEGILQFDPGDVSKRISIAVHSDLLEEPDEVLFLQLSEAVNAFIVDRQGVGTIIDDDLAPAIQSAATTVLEGEVAEVAVTLSAPSQQIVSVRYLSVNGTARSESDYTGARGELVFQPEVTSQTISIATIDDTLSEPAETLTILFSAAINATLPKATARVTIEDNDRLPTFSISDATVRESDNAPTTALFSVGLDLPSAQPVSVSFSTVARTAVSGADFTPASGTLVFPAGIASQTIPIDVLGDRAHEPTETFIVRLSSPNGATLARSEGTATILDNDVESFLSISDGSLIEGNIGTNHMVFTIRLSESSTQPVSVQYSTAPITAVEALDYVSASGTITIPPGEVTHSVSVAVIADRLDEPNETFEIRLNAPQNAQISDGLAIGTIINDDFAPSFTIADTTITEGNEGTTEARFTVRLSSPSGRIVAVDFSTAEGTAIANADFRPVSGTLRFDPGTVTQSVSVVIISDTEFEANETFSVVLSDPSNAVLLSNRAVGTIVDDDEAVNPPPSIRIISPLNASAFTAPADITITALASDAGGSIRSVEFFVGSISLKTLTSPPYGMLWENEAAGEYALTAVATDNEGAQTTSESINILMKRGVAASEVAVIRNYPDPEIRVIQDYLLELGLSSQIFDQEGLSFESVNDYRLIIWDDLGEISQGLTANDVRVFREARNNGIPILFIGEVLAASGQNLNAAAQSDWARLIHLNPGASGVTDGIVIPDPTLEHPVVNGRFGTPANFNYPPALDSVIQPAPGVTLLARSGSSDVLVAFEDESFEGPRSVSQNFLVANGSDARSIAERKRLFKNAVVWLMRRSFQALTDLSITVSGPEGEPAAGEEFVYSATIRHRGEISGTGITLMLELPDSVRFVRGDFVQGTLEESAGSVIYHLGSMENGQQISFALTLIATQAGPITLRTTVAGNEADPVTTNNADQFETVVAPGLNTPPELSVAQAGIGELELQIRNESLQRVRIQSSANLSNWVDVTNSTARLILFRVDPATTPASSLRFYRVVSP